MDEQPAVTVEGLRKVFRVSTRETSGLRASVAGLFHREHTEVVAVDGIDLSIATGEIRALVGPNGAGKSTTIKVLSGILHPSAGRVSCLGYTPWAQRKDYVRNIGAIFGQKSQLQWDLPAIDTFTLNRRIYKIPSAVYQRNLDYFTETFGLAAILSKPVRNLSLGERMRCELTAALLHDPPLVFLDEPTIGLDLLAKDAVREFVKRVNRERNVTFLLTTHDLDDVQDLCRRITVINHGTSVFDGSIDDLRTQFVRHQVLQLGFAEPVSEERLTAVAAAHGWRVDTRSDLEATLTLTDVEGGHAAQLAAALAALPVRDVEIRTPDIESVIRQVYARP
jgi:ABC-2 type transport system ATP-binding protein